MPAVATATSSMPRAGHSITAYSTPRRATTASTEPAGSTGAASRSRDSGSSSQPATNATTTTGMFTRNTDPHQ